VNVIRFLKIGVVLTGLFIYKDSYLLKNKRDRIPFRYCKFSYEKPYIVIKNHETIKSRENNDKWEYSISMGDNNAGVNLDLITTSKPWIGTHPLGRWLVIPQFNINGRILLDDKIIDVLGHGYHDHNIYPLYAPFFNKGYDFGKIPINSSNLVWAKVSKNKKNNSYIAVFNTEKNSFVTIQPEDISLQVLNYKSDHGKNIPTKYNLNIKNDQIVLNVLIESIGFHHISIPSVNYWRHHVKNIGEIKIGSKIEKINNIEILEQLRFF
jgi:hypothetical protein